MCIRDREVPDEKIVDRMGGRRVCESCGASYHVVNIPPKKEGVCDVCGGALKQRKDDDPETVKMCIRDRSTTVLGLYNVMSGGAFANATVFALGVQPYINSSIIIQLLTIAIPALQRMAQDGGEEGKKKIQSITRYATCLLYTSRCV